MQTASKIIKGISDFVAGMDDPLHRLSTQVGMLQGELRKLLPEQLPMPNGSFRCSADIDGLGDCVIFYDYSPGRQGRMYMPNGDPGYPDDPAELCVTAVQIGGGEFDYEVFSDDVKEQLERACENDVITREESAQAERAEYERDYE